MAQHRSNLVTVPEVLEECLCLIMVELPVGFFHPAQCHSFWLWLWCGSRLVLPSSEALYALQFSPVSAYIFQSYFAITSILVWLHFDLYNWSCGFLWFLHLKFFFLLYLVLLGLLLCLVGQHGLLPSLWPYLLKRWIRQLHSEIN